MSRAFTLLIAILMASPVVAASPIAEILCESTPDLSQKLTHQFGESRTAIGTRSPEQVVELWTDPTGDWTLVVTYATGRSCIVAMGENWTGLLPAGPA